MRASVCARACVCDVTRLYSDRPPFLVTVLNVKSYIYINIFLFFFFFFLDKRNYLHSVGIWVFLRCTPTR